MAIKSLGRWTRSGTKKGGVQAAKHLMHLRLIPRDDIPGFTGSAIQMGHEINNNWLIEDEDRDAVQMPTVYETAAKTYLEQGCLSGNLVYLSFDRSAWLATTIESICFDCKNKAISVVFEQAEIEDDYEAELPDKHFARLLRLSERLRTASSAARNRTLKEIKSYLLDIYSTHLIPLLKTRPNAPRTFLTWALENRKREAIDRAINDSKTLARQLQRKFLDPELSDWCSTIVELDVSDIREELLHSEDSSDEDESEAAPPSSDTVADVSHDALSGGCEGEELEEKIPEQDGQLKPDAIATDDSPFSEKSLLLCPPDLRKRGLILGSSEWRIIEHCELGIVNNMATFERVQVAINAEVKAEEAYHAAYRRHKTDDNSPKKTPKRKKKKWQDAEEKAKPSATLHIGLARRKHNTAPRQTRSQMRASVGLPAKRPDYTIPSPTNDASAKKASKRRSVPGRPTQRGVLQEIVQSANTYAESVDSGISSRGALTPVSPSARSPSPVKPGPARGIYMPSGVIYTSSIESNRVKTNLPSRSALSTTAENDEEDDMEEGWQVKVVPLRNRTKRPDLKRSPSSRDLSSTPATTNRTVVEDIGLGFDDDDSDSELEEDAEGECEKEFENILLGGLGHSLDNGFDLFKESPPYFLSIGTTANPALEEDDSSDDDVDEVRGQGEGIHQKVLIPVPSLLEEDHDQALLRLEESENMEFLRGLVVPFDYGKTSDHQAGMTGAEQDSTLVIVEEPEQCFADQQNAVAMSTGVQALQLGSMAKQAPAPAFNPATSSKREETKQESTSTALYRTAGLSAAVSAFQVSKGASHPGVTRRYGSNTRSYGNGGSTNGSQKFTSRPTGKDENSLLSTNDFLKDMYDRCRQRSPSPPPTEFDRPLPLRSPPRKRQKIC